MTLEELVKELERRGIQAEDLDDLVHDIKSEEAADINNDGMEAQIAYLLDSGMGSGDILAEFPEGGR